MTEPKFTYTTYTDGRVKSLIVDGTHWVSVPAANMQERMGISKVLTDLRDEIAEELPTAQDNFGGPIAALEWVIDLIGEYK